MSFYTEEERKKPHYFMGEYFEFFTCADLSIGIVVKPITEHKKYYDNKELLSRDIMCFTADWCYFTKPKLNGFDGLSRINWKYE